MAGNMQDGIYYDRPLGNSFCLMFLKISRSVHSSDLAKELSELWKLYDELKRGKVKDLDIQTYIILIMEIFQFFLAMDQRYLMGLYRN